MIKIDKTEKIEKNNTEKGTAHQHILDAATELFYRDGIRAVGVDTIIEKAGVARMTFYKHFKSKDLLVLEFLQRRDEFWLGWFKDAVERHANNPQERPLAIFDAIQERFCMPEFRGCIFINTMVEIADPSQAAFQAAAEHKEQVRQYIQVLLDEAGAAEPEMLSHQFLLLLDGAYVTAYREGSPRAAQAARHIAAKLLAVS